MELFFVDDSGDPGDPNIVGSTNYLVLGGIIINSPEQWIYLRDSLHKTKQGNNINPDREVKWNDIGNPNEYTDTAQTRRNPLYHLSMGERIKFAMDVLSIIAKDNSIVIQCVVTEKRRKFPPGKLLPGTKPYTPDDLFNKTYEILLERYEYHLAPKSAKIKKYGLIIEDQTSSISQDKRVREFAERIVRSGTEFAEIKHLIETIMFVPSDASIGIQYSDFCVGAVGRKYNSGDDKYFQIIKLNFRGWPKLGWGLKEYKCP